MSELTVEELAQVSRFTQKEIAALKDIFSLNSDLTEKVSAVEATLVGTDDFWEAALTLGRRLVWEEGSPDPINADQLEQLKRVCGGSSFFMDLATC